MHCGQAKNKAVFQRFRKADILEPQVHPTTAVCMPTCLPTPFVYFLAHTFTSSAVMSWHFWCLVKTHRWRLIWSPLCLPPARHEDRKVIRRQRCRQTQTVSKTYLRSFQSKQQVLTTTSDLTLPPIQTLEHIRISHYLLILPCLTSQHSRVS